MHWIVLLLLIAWFAAALGIVLAGGLLRLLPPVLIPPLLLLTLAAVAYVPPLRRWAAEVDPRAMVALHLVRFVGAYFLLLWWMGQLPGAFAIPAAIGDLIVAAGAVALLAVGHPSSRGWRRALLAWNIFGLADILLVILNGMRIAQADPAAVEPFRRLPLGLLPTFFLPLIIATHLIMLVRLLRSAERGNPGLDGAGAS